MPDPYRDPARRCPACAAPLRPFRGRLVCDACDGLFAPLADLATAIEDLTGVSPELVFERDAVGQRACPACGQPMTRCHLRVTLDGETIAPRPELDRCDAHGVWFDTDELAAVFELARAKHPGGSTVTVRPIGVGGSWSAHGDWGGDQGGVLWWKFLV